MNFPTKRFTSREDSLLEGKKLPLTQFEVGESLLLPKRKRVRRNII